MENDSVKFIKIRNFLRYARNHRIPIHPETRKIGVVCTLIGWSLIAFIETAVPMSLEGADNFLSFFNFFVAFGAGTLWLFICSLFLSKNFLSVKESTESKTQDQTQHITHLSAPERWSLIFWRGLLAAIGYMFYSWSRYNSQLIDNSALFSTDAIMYALIMVFVLKMKVSMRQWSVISIVFLGVCSTVSFNILGSAPIHDNFISLVVALGSAGTLAIIILLNTVIIQHDPPLRVAFFQCLIGFVCAAIVVGSWISIDPTVYDLITQTLIVNAAIAGIIYAISLIFLFNAFLYSEPFLIVLLGYSLIPFTIFFSWLAGHAIPAGDILGAALITLGGLSSVFLQFKEDKKTSHANVAGYPLYLSTLKDKFRALRDDFLQGRLGKLEYLAQRHEFNKLLFEINREIKTTEIEKIEIGQEGVLFTLQPFEIKMLSDGGCRSAPLEILNFGSYEKEETFFVFQAIEEGDVIFDIGANLGWYAIQFAKRFQQVIIHAFEPIPQTFSVLKRNIELNNLETVFLHNFGLGKTDEEVEFFYFKSGSAIASRQNLLDHQKVSKIECRLTSLDAMVSLLDLKRLDFLKCDVEGSELDVIRGGIHSLKKFLPIIYIELFTGWCQKFGYLPNDVAGLLKELGYNCFAIKEKFLIQTEEIQDNNENYNFFFLVKEKQKHEKFIKKFSNKK